MLNRNLFAGKPSKSVHQSECAILIKMCDFKTAKTKDRVASRLAMGL